uniref:Uncharacterized protein n=1 Tax=Micrurus spixii TaxID=129469 RepID=A0A2D4N615_9SAUR
MGLQRGPALAQGPSAAPALQHSPASPHQRDGHAASVFPARLRGRDALPPPGVPGLGPRAVRRAGHAAGLPCASSGHPARPVQRSSGCESHDAPAHGRSGQRASPRAAPVQDAGRKVRENASVHQGRQRDAQGLRSQDGPLAPQRTPPSQRPDSGTAIDPAGGRASRGADDAPQRDQLPRLSAGVRGHAKLPPSSSAWPPSVFWGITDRASFPEHDPLPGSA